MFFKRDFCFIIKFVIKKAERICPALIEFIYFFEKAQPTAETITATSETQRSKKSGF